jgi:hypothetical protein
MLEDSHPLSMTCKPKGKETEAGKKIPLGQRRQDHQRKSYIQNTFANLESFEREEEERTRVKKAKPEICCRSATFV